MTSTPSLGLVLTAEQAGVEKPSLSSPGERDGHIEIGDQEGFDFVVRALDYDGEIFEDDRTRSLGEALAALKNGRASSSRGK